MLPLSLIECLHAPVPFVIGVPSLPDNIRKELKHCLILDVDSNSLTAPSLPALPFHGDLLASLQKSHKVLYKKERDTSTLRHPYRNTAEELEKVHGFLDATGLYYQQIEDKIEQSITTTLKMKLFDFDNPLHLQLLVESMSGGVASHRDFLCRFFQTQLFACRTDSLSRNIMDKKQRMILKIVRLIEKEEQIKTRLKEEVHRHAKSKKAKQLEEAQRNFIHSAKRLKSFEKMKKDLEENGSVTSSGGNREGQ